MAALAAADVAARGQRGQRRHSGRDPQRLVGAAVHQLQQLHSELDVAEAAVAQLELPVGTWSATRRRIAWTSTTKFSRPAAVQTMGATAARYRSARGRPGWVWVSSVPRGRRCSHDRSVVLGRRLPPLNGVVPATLVFLPAQGLTMTRHHQGFTVVHPSQPSPRL